MIITTIVITAACEATIEHTFENVGHEPRCFFNHSSTHCG
jgi:hypothetical protein